MFSNDDEFHTRLNGPGDLNKRSAPDIRQFPDELRVPVMLPTILVPDHPISGLSGRLFAAGLGFSPRLGKSRRGSRIDSVYGASSRPTR